MKMKVLIIGHNFVVRENQKRIDYLLSAHKDISIKLITPKWWYENTQKFYLERKQCNDFQIIPAQTIFTGNNTLSFYISKLFSTIIEFKPDIIEVFEEPWSLTLFQITLIKRIFRIKAKLICYSAQNICKTFPFPFNFIEKQNFKKLSAIHVCSKGVQEVLLKKQYLGMISIIGLGLDLDAYTFKEQIKTNIIELGFIGRIVESKGIFDLLEAIAKIENCHLRICGNGPDLGKLQAYISSNQLSNKVTILGAQNREGVINFYHSLDLLVVPSKTTQTWKEQFGRIIIEAYATGTSVLGSTSGSIPEIIGEFGLIFEEGNIADIISKIKIFTDDYTLWSNKKKAARDWVFSNFSWSTVANQFYNLYKAVLR